MSSNLGHYNIDFSPPKIISLYLAPKIFKYPLFSPLFNFVNLFLLKFYYNSFLTVTFLFPALAFCVFYKNRENNRLQLYYSQTSPYN